MIDLVQHLTKAGSAVKLAEQIESLVRQGRIPPESLLPPVRTLAKDLEMSPGTAAAGYKVAVEDPGFNEHHASVRAHGMIPVPVAIDEEGMLPDSLAAALRGGARAVVLCPRFQSPTGSALTKRRATALRAVLAAHPGV